MSVEPIRVFIGTDDTQAVSTAVLKHSIVSRTDSPLEFRELRDLHTGLENEFYTGFSFYRWGIPRACDFEGRAVYLDTDIVVLCDIEELWRLPLDSHSHLCRPRPRFGFRGWRPKRLGGAYTSVMLVDCARAQDWNFPDWCAKAAESVQFYREVMWCLPGSPTERRRGDLPAEFNHLDHYDARRTKIIHYTDLPNQPWKKTGHHHERVFRTAIREAYEAGAIDLAAVEEDIGKGHVHDQMVSWCTDDPVAA